MPSYLYWELAIVAYSLAAMIRTRRFDTGLAVAKLASAAFVYLVYTPLICFSGLYALSENRYVTGQSENLHAFIPIFITSIRSTIQYTFNAYVEHRSLLLGICFALPFLLTPFVRRRRVFTTLIYLVLAWSLLSLIILYTKRYPYPRNLIAHVSLSLVALLLLLNDLLTHLPARRLQWRMVVLTGVAAATGVHFARFDRNHIHDSIYFYRADTRYRTLQAAVTRLPDTAVVLVSAEGFYWQYLCRKRGLRASMCETADATHYIYISNQETIPPRLRGRTSRVDRADEYDILRIRQ